MELDLFWNLYTLHSCTTLVERFCCLRLQGKRKTQFLPRPRTSQMLSVGDWRPTSKRCWERHISKKSVKENSLSKKTFQIVKMRKNIFNHLQSKNKARAPTLRFVDIWSSTRGKPSSPQPTRFVRSVVTSQHPNSKAKARPWERK